ncbi:Kinesin motor domain containing protein [Trichomonas vaginalis G3]|uniref:Kinesin motor domain containing protein n=1 Tax=Trichomonas vaginalis (strain ATCC PRA-98 / G3) TaxID=412133 RepID=A2DXH6_TRIV3|nr:microtubule motor protein [Trichomonas vaginalis G3]EAY14928.1 Kinesin motor domain containing protein [Trichomonas vaginalis G3]KAI5485406.1 microtubule motor protein [Trichomonas vaginalis G3]|eukprot:XP_001327151.1 Kinesin motor domain containing protein [Trichomonas vaginalis G3]
MKNQVRQPRENQNKDINDLSFASDVASLSSKSQLKSPKTPTDTNSQNPETNNNSDDKIKVYLRVRPPLQDEESFDFSIEGKTIIIPPQKTANSSFFIDNKTFTFRSILGAHCKQSQVYQKVAEPLIKDFLAGNDVLIFCYGNTNAGKTYTVMGTDENPGILPRLLERVVPEILSQATQTTQLFATFNEIYNERIIDLLNVDKMKDTLTIGINNLGDTEIKGCTEFAIKSMEDATKVIELGLEGRHRGCTEFNEDSSRSHTVFRLKLVNGKNYSWFSVVDLAGSERVSVINSEQGSFREACNINKSMLVLGKCIRSLREQSTPGSQKIPIPYRESKLTHIFKNLFEPTKRQARAAMIINISPCIQQINDTLFALQFAAKASECSIRQVSIDANSANGGSPTGINLLMDDHIDPDSPEYIERSMRVQVQKEMEEYLLKAQMQYEHQLQLMTQKTCEVAKVRTESQCSFRTVDVELERLKGILDETNNENNNLLMEIDNLEKEEKESMKRADSANEESKRILNEVNLLKKTLEMMANDSDQCDKKSKPSKDKMPNAFEEIYKLPEQIMI